jgi:phage terminase small subunit
MNQRQTAFVQEYLIDLNASAAYRRAGYNTGNPDVTGPRLLGTVGIQAALRTALAARIERTEIDQDMVISGLLREAHAEGPGSSHSARVAAWTTLARHLGMLTDRSTTETHGTIVVVSGVPRSPDDPT